MSSDALVIGAGIIGAACARALAEAGMSVVVLDREAVAAGTTGQGEGNLLVSDKEPGPELTLAQRSLDLWEGLRNEAPPWFPSTEYEKKGGLVVALTPEDGDLLLPFAESQRKAGVQTRPVDPAEALRLEPDLNPAVVAAVHYPEDAQVQPAAAAEALLAAARARGAQVLCGERVTGPLRDAPGRVVGVRTERGEHRAGRVIVAAGPWSGEVAAALGARLPVRPRRGVVLVTTRMPHRIYHKVYDADYVGSVSSNAAALQTSSVIESTASGTVLIGSSRRQVGFDVSLDMEAIREIAEKAVRVFPFLSDAAVMRVYGGFRPFVPDHLPVIGADPEVEGVWYATGHEGAGIGLCLGTADLLRDLLLESPPALDPAPFSPARPSLRAVPAEGDAA